MREGVVVVHPVAPTCLTIRTAHRHLCIHEDIQMNDIHHMHVERRVSCEGRPRVATPRSGHVAVLCAMLLLHRGGGGSDRARGRPTSVCDNQMQAQPNAHTTG